MPHKLTPAQRRVLEALAERESQLAPGHPAAVNTLYRCCLIDYGYRGQRVPVYWITDAGREALKGGKP